MSFLSDDVDRANEICNKVFYESHVEPARHLAGPFGFELIADRAGPMTYGIGTYGCEIAGRIGGLDMTYTVAIGMRGVFSMQYAQEDVAVDPYTAAVSTPTSTLGYRGFRAANDRLFVLTFDQEAIDNQLRALLGRDRIGALDLKPSLDLRTGRGAQWWRLTSTLALALQSPNSLATNPMMTAELSSSIMTGLLLAADHPYREDLETWKKPVPPVTIRKAQEIIESRAHEPLTIADIAAEIGCTARAIQIGYRKYLNMTPAEHLRRVRMDRAHTMLKFANPDSTTVAKVAAIWGFHQAGRFAGEYRKIYGVSPSVTLRDA